MPYTYFKVASDDWWSTQIHDVSMQIRSGADVERVGNGIQAFFERRYGKAGKFRIGSDMILIAQKMSVTSGTLLKARGMVRERIEGLLRSTAIPRDVGSLPGLT